MVDYWVDHPPVHKLVAAFIGHKPRKKEAEKQNDLMELMAMFPGGSIR